MIKEYILSIGGVILNTARDEVVLVGHKETADHFEDEYGLPSGKVRPTEEPFESVIRTVSEETGLSITREDLHRLPKFYLADIETKSGIKSYIWLVYEIVNYSGEFSSLYETFPVWVPIQDLDSYKLLPNVSDAISQALNNQTEH